MDVGWSDHGKIRRLRHTPLWTGTDWTLTPDLISNVIDMEVSLSMAAPGDVLQIETAAMFQRTQKWSITVGYGGHDVRWVGQGVIFYPWGVSSLPQREVEVLACISAGLSLGQIVERVGWVEYNCPSCYHSQCGQASKDAQTLKVIRPKSPMGKRQKKTSRTGVRARVVKAIGKLQMLGLVRVDADGNLSLTARTSALKVTPEARPKAADRGRSSSQSGGGDPLSRSIRVPLETGT